jgi:hypothetical protein
MPPRRPIQGGGAFYRNGGHHGGIQNQSQSTSISGEGVSPMKKRHPIYQS